LPTSHTCFNTWVLVLVILVFICKSYAS
jgi:hypothetical protein